MPAHRPPPTHTVGRALPWRLRCLAWLLHAFYFGRFPIRGAVPPDSGAGPRLIVASHRNGAIDGYTVLRAFPRAQFLVAVQLLRSPWLRLLFGGIPVVRDKDRERYGLRRAAYGDPVEAACAHLRAGGDLVLFPEGSSEWGHRPLPYQRGAARIARVLLAEGRAAANRSLGSALCAAGSFSFARRSLDRRTARTARRTTPRNRNASGKTSCTRQSAPRSTRFR